MIKDAVQSHVYWAPGRPSVCIFTQYNPFFIGILYGLPPVVWYLLNNTWWQQCSTDRIFSVTAKPTDSYIEGGIGFRRVKSNNQIITHSVSWLLSDTVDMLTYIQEEH